MEKRILKNMMETLVEKKLEESLKAYDCCKCDICQMDMMTHALNNLPAKYVATSLGEVYAKTTEVSI